jgi:hypothetical protein
MLNLHQAVFQATLLQVFPTTVLCIILTALWNLHIYTSVVPFTFLS